MIVGVEDTFIYLLVGLALVSTIFAVLGFILIKMGGVGAWAFIKAGFSKASRVLFVFGTDQSCGIIVARASGDGVVDESRGVVRGAYITPKGSFYLAGKQLVAPVYSPFGIAWNAEVLAFLEWVKIKFGKENMKDVLEDVGVWEEESLTDKEGKALIDQETQTPIKRRILTGIDKKKMATYKYDASKEWDLVCKKHQKYVSGRSFSMETALGWVTKNINPNFFKSVVEFEKARVIRKMQKDHDNQIVKYGLFALFVFIGIAILWVATGGFGSNHGSTTTIIQQITNATGTNPPKIVK